MEWLKRRLRKWLGVDKLATENMLLTQTIENLVNIGVDVHFKSPHMILIYSKLNGGQLRHIDADFKDIRDLQRFVGDLKARFRTNIDTWDTPPQMRGFL